MIIYSLRLAIFGSRFHPVRCRCYHPSWLDRSQRIPLWGLPDLSPKDARTWWLSGEQVFPAQPPFWEREEGHFIALLLYSDDAKPAGWFCQEETNKEFALENRILFVAFHDLRLSVSLALHNSIRHSIFYLMFETVVQRSLSKICCKGKKQVRSISA